MSVLGIYFGPKVISLVETENKRILKNVNIPYAESSGSDLEEKVPDEIKIVALIKEELRKNQIDAREAVITLSGKDLIVRNFEMPNISQDEMQSAVNFEAKKYIPFKVEELISDFQSRPEANHKNQVLYVGIKKTTLAKYLNILQQLSIKSTAIEYSDFSNLRALKLTGVNDRGILGIISVDLEEEKEASFIVLDNGFPLFSRDIALGSESAAEQPKVEELQAGPNALVEKLKSELRVSVDFYNRKFPTRAVKRAALLTSEDTRFDLENIVKEIGLTSQFVETKQYYSVGKFSLPMLKAYSCSIAKVIKTGIRTNLLAARDKKITTREIRPIEAGSLFTDIHIQPGLVIIGVVICGLAFVYGYLQRLPIQTKINEIISQRPQVTSASGDASYEELSAVDTQHKEKLDTIQTLVNKKLLLTKPINAIPRDIPDGMWLVDFTFSKESDRISLTLKGIAYLEDSDKEIRIVNQFAASLKQDSNFTRYFDNIMVSSVERGQFGDTPVTNFIISCSGNDIQGE